MVRVTRLLLVLAVLEATLPVPRGLAEAPDPASASSSAAAADAAEPNLLPGLPRPPDQPASLLQTPPSGPGYSCAPLPGPYFERDPRLDPPPLPPPGWVADVDVGILVPHVKNKLIDTVQVGARPPDTVQLPSAELSWTGSPRFEVGYRLPSGFGEILLAYRFLVTDGTGSAQGPDATEALTSRFDMNVADLDYASREFSLLPHCGMKWRFGLRGVDLFFDSHAIEPFAAAAAGSGIFDTRVSNNYWGIGPHMGLELERRWEDEGVVLVGRVDAATLLGRVNQGFSEESTTPAPGGELLSGTTRQSNPQDVPEVNAFLGVGWRPPEYPTMRLELGYQYEYWWNVGRLSTTNSRGEVSDQGVVLRVEFNY